MKENATSSDLKQNLQGWMIFFIVITSLIGSGIFSTGGPAIEVAGPGGALLALVIVGIIAICMAEGLSELTQLFPAPNAIVEYVRAFVDKDYAWVVGIAYWFTYISIFAGQNLMAAKLSEYWGLKQVWQIVLFYFATPTLLVCINLVGVGTFGWVEAVSGILKIILVVGLTIVLYVMAAQEGNWSGNGPIQVGFQHNSDYATNGFRAVAYVIPMIAFSFLGIESVAVTAFEARSSKSLRLPSQSIAYVALVLYFLCLLGQLLNVSWDNKHLPQIYGGIGNDTQGREKPIPEPGSSSMTIIALWAWGAIGHKALAGFLNGAMIFAVMSAGNTSLYIASRTLYGLARDVPRTTRLGRLANGFSHVVPSTGVPARALLLSAFAFIWLPFVSLKSGYAIQYLIEIVQISSSISCLIVWASLSFAYLRYYLWLKSCKEHLIGDRFAQFKRNTSEYKPFTVLAFAQPLPAIISIVGCLVVLGFCSATWWSSPVTFAKVAIGYTAPFFVAILFILFKIVNRRLWVRTGTNWADFSQALQTLKWYKSDEIDPEHELQEVTGTRSPPIMP
ncbi:hypothetical protein HBI38_092300 [Parastagonospora nodorum]|nr:hypothetical protein HBH52_102090 [Parastagonospora nodorum]KAH4955866.1 hypothetical protein HBH73_093760 [Parastagonospora nodorum]KAH5102238.1 hypothetical protein HBH72_088600 [Parastagonospora nodorum]KAH5164590.1 hypothetical protein HBI73_047300 [Parastagonospora nodorum]KAH5203535.1 hypothetical protein HBH68_106740 [Parastagonospora nodorum]